MRTSGNGSARGQGWGRTALRSATLPLALVLTTASAAKRQLEHLLEQSEREHITVQVIPFAIGAYPGSGQNIHYACGLLPQLDTVSLDQSHGPVLLDAEAQLEMYRILLDRMERVALEPSKSRDFIHDLIHDL
ncbi:Scr1 family TA system antitoxin-like transcriptional regulator [Streptomyces sp. Root1310]|uniref:Scr1 family TA system antitoxin-like transcriptional regulator n=1 Tax=Streptomyces sp. Root1310 TaxID=1736452 RepID=UPI000ADBAB3B|nr:Scr1 family TA system antitoxin-like transcriptional regulator [Streptomyces sp. Root1310]